MRSSTSYCKGTSKEPSHHFAKVVRQLRVLETPRILFNRNPKYAMERHKRQIANKTSRNNI
eukprot:2197446-Amphidinium_carterae.1